MFELRVDKNSGAKYHEMSSTEMLPSEYISDRVQFELKLKRNPFPLSFTAIFPCNRLG